LKVMWCTPWVWRSVIFEPFHRAVHDATQVRILT
jgi:hypothetical protein